MITKNYTTVTPAYGRDYPNKKAVVSAWESVSDFILQDITSQWDGKPCNINDVAIGTTINLRYGKMRKVSPVVVKAPAQVAL